MIIRIAQFELRSVHTREVIVIIELRSVHTRDRIWGFAFQSGRRCLGTLPWIKHARSSYFLCFIWIVHMQCAVYIRKWLEGRVAPPPNHNLEVKAFIRRFCCVIWEKRNWKTPLDRHLNCAFQMTHYDVIWRTHVIQNVHNSNDNSNCALCSRVKTVQVKCAIANLTLEIKLRKYIFSIKIFKAFSNN